jgi:S-adenosyl-L-methionine hydrolase (adenosine-forming)
VAFRDNGRVRYDWVSFTTDYGTADGFVAACKGVIAGIAPAVRVLDVTHEIDPQDIRRGGTVLAHTVAYLPPAIHLAVVDPGVGGTRRAVVLVAGPSLFVGPDNGLLIPAADALGGVVAAYELTEPRYHLPEVSMTFHGRDVFAPATAHLANGVSPADLGPAIEPGALRRLAEPRTTVEDGRLTSEILGADRFGNLQLAAGGADLLIFGARPGELLRVQLRRSAVDARLGGTFADVPAGTLLVHLDSAGRIAVAVNGGSAAEALGGRVGEVTISR